MKKLFLITFIFFLVFLFSIKGLCDFENETSLKIPGWRLTWNDEFDGDSVDELKWLVEDAALIKNNELQYYTPEDVYVHDGVLTLRSQKRSMGGRPYTSGLVETKGKFSQKYGRFEIRAKLPKGKGIWPAHWLLPAVNKWPPEIDIMEMLGHEPNRVYGTVHWGTYPNNKHSGSSYIGPDFSEDFHIFAIEWEPDEIRWYVDGEEFYNFTTESYIPQETMRIILNTAVGGDWPGNPDATTVFPQYHDIDYVRVYTADINILSILSDSLPNGKVGTYYSEQLVASGGSLPYVWSVLTGQLPEGLVLDGSTGNITGTCLREGSYEFSIQISDADLTTNTKEFSIFVEGYADTDAKMNMLNIYPNPFNPYRGNIKFTYEMSQNARGEVEIYNIVGESVRTIPIQSGAVGGSKGYNEIEWNGRNDQGNMCSSGIYIFLFRLNNEQGETIIEKGKVALIK